MTQSTQPEPGMSAQRPYPSRLKDPALVDFVNLPAATQRCIDEALSEIEMTPWPVDAQDLSDGFVLSVHRCELWIVYERNEDEHMLDVWRILP